MNGYKAFYRGRTVGVFAETSREAQRIAAADLRANKVRDVTVVLCVKDVDDGKGQTVIHSGAEF